MVASVHHQVRGLSISGLWQAKLRELIGSHDASVGDDCYFEGDVRSFGLGSLHLTNVQSLREASRRTPQHVRQDPQDKYILVNVRSGIVRLRQQRSECEMTAGSLTLYRTDVPFEWEHRDSASVRSVAIPAAALRARLRNIDSYLLRPQSGQNGVWRILSDMLGSLSQQCHSIPLTATHTLAAQLIELLGVAIEIGDEDGVSLGTETTRKASYRNCVNLIRSNLADDLTPEKIARTAGLSVRSLHRLFQDVGEPVGTFLRNARLEKCHRDLADPGKFHFSIGEIAYQAGFRSQAHFANIFKTRYGISAGEWRRSAQLR
ncbi:helix-turn-helix domain-containing protein [Bradyrhizobium sp. dw_78]|uniref:helix-turn-helix domain-containing protein n=1 Tax=Bradyrhizobium sp. dw_78 TaxID=2719793 RepID=UPI001BD3973F|nr:helix-turn-helix domain-containing protein [Bradyrhizobium sp. dw_78]